MILKSIKKTASLAAVITSLLIGSQSAVAQNSPAEVQQYFDNLQNLQSSFSQIVFDEKGSKVETSHGVLKISKPGKAYWDYTTPYRQELVSNGKKVWFYDKDLSQVTVRNVADVSGRLPASILTGSKPIASEFTIKRVGKQSDGVVRWSLLPKSSKSEYKSMLFGFTHGQLSQIEVVNKQDHLTMLALRDVQQNISMPKSIFDFQIPAGVDVFN
jgi:outer membrane lipoprotein carrier protein